jgi:protein SCO1/2
MALLVATGPVAAAGEADPHAHHAQQGAAPVRMLAKPFDYKLPAVKLVRADGKTVELAAELADSRPVMLNFVFTTCTAICPLMSFIFADVQQRLGPDGAKLHMVSISIDPEQDTPARLREFAARYKAGPGWDFYTGTAAASISVQKALNAYRGDKMNHEPLTLLRKGPDQPWIRVEGLASPEELMTAVRPLMAAK